MIRVFLLLFSICPLAIPGKFDTLQSMSTAISKRTDGTIELTLTIPWANVKTSYEEMVDKAVENAEVTGFRKGKAPRNLVEEKLDKSKVYEEVIGALLPKVYNEAVTAEKLKPIITPKVELKEATENKDWIVRILTCEKPTLTIGDYKKAITDLKATKQKKIWVPGEEPKKDEEGKAENANKPTLDELLKALYSIITATLPELLMEHEVNRLLSDLIDQTKKLGLSVEQYLASTGRNADSIRSEYAEQAKRSLTLEFALEDIADKEGILISDDDIDTVIKSSKSEEEQKALSGQRYYLASILRRQKTLDFLSSLN